MGNDTDKGRLQVGTLAELDALVGRYVTGAKPQTHWEDSHGQLRFDTIDEALEALREPYFQQFIPARDRASTVLREVEVYLPYSADLNIAWDLIARLASAQLPIRLWRAEECWHATFGQSAETSAATASIAICLAALRARGVEVDWHEVVEEEHEPSAQEMLSRLRPGMLAD